MFQQPFTFAYFGSSEFSVFVLDGLRSQGFLPSLIVTTPDKPRGRKLEITPTEVKVWGQENNIPVLTPEKLDADFNKELVIGEFDFFVVASYGKIIPQHILDIPPKHVLNVHPSLLPKYRGATPLQTALLNDDRDTGVSIMVLDAKMDHGPIIAQKKVEFEVWPMMYLPFEKIMADEGAKLLAEIMPAWNQGTIEATPQNHELATYTQKVSKEDGLINLDADARSNYLKYCAYTPWPSVYFFVEKNGVQIRVKIVKATYKTNATGGAFVIEKVIPEGKGETDYETFMKSLTVQGLL